MAPRMIAAPGACLVDGDMAAPLGRRSAEASVPQRTAELDFGDAGGVGGREVAAAFENLERVFGIGQAEGLGLPGAADGDLGRDGFPRGVDGGLPVVVAADGAVTPGMRGVERRAEVVAGRRGQGWLLGRG